MKRLLLTFVALVVAFTVMAAENVIVPRPTSFESQKGKLSLTSKSVVAVSDKSLVRPATMFCAYVAAEKGLTLSVVENGAIGKGAIALSLDKKLGEEEYLLEVTKNGVVVKGGSEKAVFYGLQSCNRVIF